jgi:acyl-CoA synthetase (AMP-forming)/AMP-acid ligase II
MNLVELLRGDDRPALIDPKRRTLTFRQLKEQVGRFAGGLVDLGLRPGDRVVLLVPMSFELYVCLLGLFHIGATAVLVDPKAPVEDILSRFRPVALIGSPRAHLLRLKVRALRGLGLYISTGFTPLPHWRLSSIKGNPPPVAPGAHPALLTFTTGSTGSPKAIARTHAFLLQQHRILGDHMDLGEDDVDLPTLPVFLLHSLAGGATCVLADADLRKVGSVQPERVLAQMAREGVTSLSGSPAFLGPLAHHLVERGQTNTTVRRIDTGGARVAAPVLRDLCAAFPKAVVTVLYGSSEAEPIALLDGRANLAALEDGERTGRGALVGSPVDAIEVRIDEDEVLVAGPHVNPSYYQDPEADARHKVQDGDRVWHRTGDAGFLDDSGRLWLVGRAGKRIAGRWPMTVEAPAELLPFVSKAALVDIDGEPQVACVLSQPPEDWAAQVQHAAGVPAFSLPSIPVDPRHNAKIDREALDGVLRRR